MRGLDLSRYHETVAGRVVNLLLVIFGSGVCGAFILVIAIYVDSLLFMLGSSLMQFTLDANANVRVCRATILLCITAYLSSKLLIYLFLVDRAYIVRDTLKPRLKSRLYLFHLGFILGNHANDITSENLCVIAVNHDILICITVVDVIINVGYSFQLSLPGRTRADDGVAHPQVYLTTLFLRPIIQSHSFRGQGRSVDSKRGPLDTRLRSLTKKTFLGTCCTLLSSLAAIVIQCITNNEHTAAARALPPGSGSAGSWDSSTYYRASTTRQTGSSTLYERGCGGGGGGRDEPGHGSQDMVLGPLPAVLPKDEGRTMMSPVAGAEPRHCWAV
ncbi:hypothetical protein PG993_011809 [Apiospora rasikravindrae]|uniref:Pheromone receptor n=1 Tax=Apiospora rasikravindrae TaxID=990691 RepID=A0ABR1S0U4_9PEZI